MKKKTAASLGLATALLLAVFQLSGCAALLERSYGVSEPYADRYWDSSAEDTLRVETYQDLVNSLLMLVAQRAEEGVIRCYGEVGAYPQTLAAKREICQETMQGSYLLKNLQFSMETGASYGTLTCTMTYREDAEDIDSLMILSDSQSLVDLLRLTVREEREKLTARFAYDTPREDVIAAVESLWQELCRIEMEENEALAAGTPEPAIEPPADELEPPEDEPPQEPEASDAPEEATDQEGESPDAIPASADPENPDAEAPEEPPEEDPIEYPPCPWGIRFYPDKETAEIVEVLLKKR